jgi:hypothetical protein
MVPGEVQRGLSQEQESSDPFSVLKLFSPLLVFLVCNNGTVMAGCVSSS